MQTTVSSYDSLSLHDINGYYFWEIRVHHTPALVTPSKWSDPHVAIVVPPGAASSIGSTIKAGRALFRAPPLLSLPGWVCSPGVRIVSVWQKPGGGWMWGGACVKSLSPVSLQQTTAEATAAARSQEQQATAATQPAAESLTEQSEPTPQTL